MPRLRFAGQITGVEGYIESAAMGLLAGRFAAAEVLGHPLTLPPPTTALGALINHITGGHILDAPSDSPVDSLVGSRPEGAVVTPRSFQPQSFQPMNINYGLLPDLPAVPTHDAEGKRLKGPDKGRAKKQVMSRRALSDLTTWLGETKTLAAE